MCACVCEIETKSSLLASESNFRLEIHPASFKRKSIMVHTWVGKEFPDMRQNERKIKFIRVGEAVRTRASSRENRCWTGVLGPFLQPGFRSRIGVLRVICRLDEACILRGGNSKAETFSLYGVEGETGYTAQEDLKFFNSYNKGERGMIRGCFFSVPAFQDLPWFYRSLHSMTVLGFFWSFIPWDTTKRSCRSRVNQ